MTASDEQILDAITDLTPKLLTTLEAFEQLQQNMDPSRVPQLKDFIAPFEDELRPAFDHLQALEFPAHLASFQKQLHDGADYCLRACNGFTGTHDDPWITMKAMRAHCRAQSFMYSIATVMNPINQYFLEQDARTNQALLDACMLQNDSTGLKHFNNARTSRGGFSLYVPEYLEPTKARSLVVALHGGTGHGADFLWSWLREARTRGFILLAPTSQQDTWSLSGEEHDLEPLATMITYIKENWAIDDNHILLTGMSDGGTYTLLAGLQEHSPFTHLAPFSGVLHPEICMSGRIRFAHERNIFLVHGTSDWMFPIETAYMAKSELESAGANLTFSAEEGLSHTYARFQNPHLITWFNPDLALPA